MSWYQWRGKISEAPFLWLRAVRKGVRGLIAVTVVLLACIDVMAESLTRP